MQSFYIRTVIDLYIPKCVTISKRVFVFRNSCKLFPILMQAQEYRPIIITVHKRILTA